MYSVGMPNITEKVMLGNDTIGFNILDIETEDSSRNTIKQREIRLYVNPVYLEVSHHYGRCIKLGVKIFRLAIRTEISYGKTTRI